MAHVTLQTVQETTKTLVCVSNEKDLLTVTLRRNEVISVEDKTFIIITVVLIFVHGTDAVTVIICHCRNCEDMCEIINGHVKVTLNSFRHFM